MESIESLEPTVVLTQDQIDFYHREGYLALDAITTQEEVEISSDPAGSGAED